MAFEEINDEELMEKVQSLSSDPNEISGAAERYFKELYKRYYPKAYKFCRYYRLGHNDSVEAIQEAFVKIFRYASSYKAGKTFKSWFFKILFNMMNDKFNELKKAKHENIEDVADFLGEESEELKSFHNRELLHGMISRLPKFLKDCLLLYIYQDMDFNTIGQTVGISSRLARNRVDQAIEELKNMAEESHE